jgi:hypothetical protein
MQFGSRGSILPSTSLVSFVTLGFLGGTTPAFAQDQAPATPTPSAAPAAPATPPAITFSGGVDVYYGYNFNNPKNGTSSGEGGTVTTAGPGTTGPGKRNFDYKDNLLTLGLAEVNIARAASAASRVGFKIGLAYGPTADLAASPGDSDNKNVLQAYGTYLVPVGAKDLSINAGKFVTFMGYEVIEPWGNWNYSRSALFQAFIPLYHAGVSVAYPLTDKLTGTAYLVNGWNNVSFDTNGNKGLGLSLNFAPSPATSLYFNGLTSNEPAGLEDKEKTTLEFIGSHAFSPAATGVVDVNYDFGKGTLPKDTTKPDTSWNAFGIAGYVHYAFKNTHSVTLRAEYYDDNDGFLTGVDGQKGQELTLTYSLKSPKLSGAETRLEYRYDHADKDGLFLDKHGNLAKKSQSTISISEILTF